MSDVKWDAIQPLEVSQEAIEQCILLLQKAGWMQEHDRILTEGKWIPCEEKLPHDREKVLICTIGKWLDIGEIIFGRWWSGSERLADVIAWQPLPKPYKGE